MDLIQINSPILILSDDEDDDDVVLVKEEKGTVDAAENEDDVIFVSAESSPSILIHKSLHQKINNKKNLESSSSSLVDANNDLNILTDVLRSPMFCLDSDNVKSLDSDETVVLETVSLSDSASTNVTLVEPIQSFSSSKTVQQQEVNEIGILSSDMLDCSSGNSACGNSFKQIKTKTSVPDHSSNLLSKKYASKRDQFPATSNHNSGDIDFCSPLPTFDGLKSCVPHKVVSPSSSESASLVVNNFSDDDFLSQFDLIYDHETEKQDKHDENIKSIHSFVNNCYKLTSLVDDTVWPNVTKPTTKHSHKTPQDLPKLTSYSALPSVKESGSSEFLEPLKSISQDYDSQAKSDKEIPHNVTSLSAPSTSLSNYKNKSHKSIIASCKKRSEIALSSVKLSKLKYCHSSHLPGLNSSNKRKSLKSKISRSRFALLNVLLKRRCKIHSFRQSLLQHELLQGRKYKLNHSTIYSDSFLKMHSHKTRAKSVSQILDPLGEKPGTRKWQIVHSESSAQTRKACFDDMNDECPKKKQKHLESSMEEQPRLKIKLKVVPPTLSSELDPKLSGKCHPFNIGFKKSILRHAKISGEHLLNKHPSINIHQSMSDRSMKKVQTKFCATCFKTFSGQNLAKCDIGHEICATCLEPQVKVILIEEVKQKKTKCPLSQCTEAVNFDELRKVLPPLVVDILEKKLDKEYLHYITKWMFTDEELKSRSEFATVHGKETSSSASSMRNYEEIYHRESSDAATDLPTFWAPMEQGAGTMVFEVVPDTEEYRALACQFYETCPFGEYDISRIIRIQNPILWKYFALKQSEMIQENDGIDVVVKQLYHGTHHSTLEAIARKGFDWRLSGKHGTAYGNGSYFAKSAQYSHAYTDCAGSGKSIRARHQPGYRFQSSAASLTSHIFRTCRQRTSYCNLFPTLHTMQPMLSHSSQSQPQKPSLPLPYTQTSRQVPHNQVLNQSFDCFLGTPWNLSTTSSLSYNSSLSAPGISSTPNSSQIQPSNFTSYFTNPSSSTSTFDTSLPALSFWDSLENTLGVKGMDIKIHSNTDTTTCRSQSAMVPQDKGTSDLSSAFLPSRNSKTHFMFVAKVLIGRHTGGKSGLKRPPPLDEKNRFGKCYDSCVDNIFSPQIYVIFDSNQAYPEYVIEYNWIKDN